MDLALVIILIIFVVILVSFILTSPNEVIICHGLGTDFERTMSIIPGEVDFHMSHGDQFGGCL